MKPLQEKLFFVNDGKVTDHHAIIPTEQFVQLEHMTVEERKIYDLVIRRFISVMYPPFEYEQTTLKFKIGSEIFTASGNVVISEGWKEVYQNNAAEEYGSSQKLPALKTGEKAESFVLDMTEGKTAPPPHFNEATLLSAMENPTSYMEEKNKEFASTLGETGGLGTVATRADIIEKLFSSFLIEKKNNDIYLTTKAKQLLELVPNDLKKPELTAYWEIKLSEIAKGRLKRSAFMKDIRVYSEDLIWQIKHGQGTFKHDNLTNTKCPVCGKRMLSVKGKNSEMLVCQDRECGHRETVSRVSNARCPKCHKKLELRGKGDNQVFICGCGYKEKLSAFQERRKKEGAGVSKKEVAKYLDKQKKAQEEPLNNPFAEAFSKLKI